MYLNCKDFRMLTGQTSLPPNPPTSLKVKNVHDFGIFQPNNLKLGILTQIERTKHMYDSCAFEHVNWLHQLTTQPTKPSKSEKRDFLLDLVETKCGNSKSKPLIEEYQKNDSFKPLEFSVVVIL